MEKRRLRILDQKEKQVEESKKRLEEAKEQKSFVKRMTKKQIAETKKLSVSLPYGYWEQVDLAREKQSRSAYIRELILKDLKEKGLD